MSDISSDTAKRLKTATDAAACMHIHCDTITSHTHASADEQEVRGSANAEAQIQFNLQRTCRWGYETTLTSLGKGSPLQIIWEEVVSNKHG